MTSVWTTSGPKLLVRVTGFRVSVCATERAEIFQTESTKLHVQEVLSNLNLNVRLKNTNIPYPLV